MDFKNTSFEIKDLDDAKGIVKAYANVYDVRDSDGDISARGSFDKTVIEQRDRIGVFKNHNPNISIGIPLEIDPKDSYGLLTTTKFDLSIPDGRDMYNHIKFKMENGRNTELSIGYEVIKRDEVNRSIIKEYKLWEYSFLTAWGANHLSTVQDLKSKKDLPQIISIIEKSYNLDYSDPTLRKIEKLLKSLSTEPSNDTQEVEPIDLLNTLNTIKWQ